MKSSNAIYNIRTFGLARAVRPTPTYRNDAISIFSWSPNKFYHRILGSHIKTVVKSCHQSERQNTKQTDKEPIVYKINSARITYKLIAWVGSL